MVIVVSTCFSIVLGAKIQQKEFLEKVLPKKYAKNNQLWVAWRGFDG